MIEKNIKSKYLEMFWIYQSIENGCTHICLYKKIEMVEKELDRESSETD